MRGMVKQIEQPTSGIGSRVGREVGPRSADLMVSGRTLLLEPLVRFGHWTGGHVDVSIHEVSTHRATVAFVY